MDKAKPLAGVLTFIILATLSEYAYAITDGTRFWFKNNTSQEYVIHRGPRIWFNPFSDIVIPPNQTRDFYVEGECFGHPQEIPLLNGLFLIRMTIKNRITLDWKL